MLAGACAAPLSYPPFDQQIERSRTRLDLENFLRRAPDSCNPTGSDAELCEWRLGPRDYRWPQIAGALDTESRVAVFCELPLDGSERAPSACDAAPLAVEDLDLKRDANAAATSSRREASGDPERLAARRRLDDARDLLSLTRLVGHGPDTCIRWRGDHQRCLWRVSHRSRGYEIIATSIDSEARVRLVCRLPLDGSARAINSCVVTEGV
jgi:hypothetical protein